MIVEAQSIQSIANAPDSGKPVLRPVWSPKPVALAMRIYSILASVIPPLSNEISRTRNQFLTPMSREVERSDNGRNTTASQEYWLTVSDRVTLTLTSLLAPGMTLTGWFTIPSETSTILTTDVTVQSSSRHKLNTLKIFSRVVKTVQWLATMTHDSSTGRLENNYPEYTTTEPFK